jgi:hypothetical protein
MAPRFYILDDVPWAVLPPFHGLVMDESARVAGTWWNVLFDFAP